MASMTAPSLPGRPCETGRPAAVGSGRAARSTLGALVIAGLLVHAAPGAPATVIPFTLHVEAPGALAPLGQRLAKMQDEALARVLHATGLEEPGDPIHVRLAPEASSLAHRAPPWVLGYADGDRGTIVLFVERIPAYPHHSLEAVFVHELTHILVRRATRGHPLPRWFNEGLAMQVAEPWDLEDRARLVLAMVGGREVSRDQLDDLFESHPSDVRRAYVLSAAFVRSMVAEWGPDFPPAVLALVARGQTFPDAFARVTATTLDAFESRFWADQRWWNRWVPLLTSSTVLWAGITLLVVYAYRARRRQALAIRRRWELEGDGD